MIFIHSPIEIDLQTADTNSIKKNNVRQTKRHLIVNVWKYGPIFVCCVFNLLRIKSIINKNANDVESQFFIRIHQYYYCFVCQLLSTITRRFSSTMEISIFILLGL